MIFKILRIILKSKQSTGFSFEKVLYRYQLNEEKKINQKWILDSKWIHTCYFVELCGNRYLHNPCNHQHFDVLN